MLETQCPICEGIYNSKASFKRSHKGGCPFNGTIVVEECPKRVKTYREMLEEQCERYPVYKRYVNRQNIAEPDNCWALVK